ncbi:MAG: signal peptidase I [Patescibacteria group bacterium]
MKKIFKFLLHPMTRWVIQAGVFLILITVVFLGTSGRVPFSEGKHLFVVLSGSMEPGIKTGSLILVKETDKEPEIDDIYTFITPRTKKIVTHRILNKRPAEDGETLLFSTKGDNNDGGDPWVLRKEDFVGKFAYSIPYVGYLVNAAKTPKGFFVLAVIPGLVIIVDEVFKIKKVMQLEYEKKILKLKNELEEEKEKNK